VVLSFFRPDQALSQGAGDTRGATASSLPNRKRPEPVNCRPIPNASVRQPKRPDRGTTMVNQRSGRARPCQHGMAAVHVYAYGPAVAAQKLAIAAGWV